MSIMPVGVPAQYHQWMYLLKNEVKQRDCRAREKRQNLDDIDRTPGRRQFLPWLYQLCKPCIPLV